MLTLSIYEVVSEYLCCPGVSAPGMVLSESHSAVTIFITMLVVNRMSGKILVTERYRAQIYISSSKMKFSWAHQKVIFDLHSLVNLVIAIKPLLELCLVQHVVSISVHQSKQYFYYLGSRIYNLLGTISRQGRRSDLSLVPGSMAL